MTVATPGLEAIATAVSLATSVPVPAVLSKNRSKHVVDARKVFVSAARQLGYLPADIQAKIGFRTVSAVYYCLRDNSGSKASLVNKVLTRLTNPDVLQESHVRWSVALWNDLPLSRQDKAVALARKHIEETSPDDSYLATCAPVVTVGDTDCRITFISVPALYGMEWVISQGEAAL